MIKTFLLQDLSIRLIGAYFKSRKYLITGRKFLYIEDFSKLSLLSLMIMTFRSRDKGQNDNFVLRFELHDISVIKSATNEG